MNKEQPAQSKAMKLGICQGIVLMLCVLLGSIACLEITFRVIGFDFDRHVQRRERTPIFLQTYVPVGEAYFVHPARAQWRGKVQSAARASLDYDERMPIEEDEILIEYDDHGFRNPLDLTDWEIAVAGDSFTESDSLPYDEMFTTRLGKELGARVKNLGVVATGTLAQTCYLKEFGKSSSTKHAVLAFYEGNDLYDIVHETQALWGARMGEREDRSLEHINKQTSFIKAIFKVIRPGAPKFPSFNAYFEADSRSVPVRIKYIPDSSESLPSGVRALLADALQGWATTARQLQMKPWLVYLPANRRVYHGHLRFMDVAEPRMQAWKPTDLPEIVQAICKDLDIAFIDPTPQLIAEADRGRLTYFPFDAHFNREGSACVALVMANAMRKEYPSILSK
jgi:hypothetical protein